MIFHIFSYEWKKLRSENLLWISTFIIAFLIVAAFINGKQWYDFENKTMSGIAADYNTQLDTTRNNLLTNSDPRLPMGIDAPQNPSRFYANYTLGTAKPLKPIAVFSIGQSDLYPGYSVFSARDKSKLIQDSEIQNPVHLMTGKFDLTFVIVYIFPLLIMAWSYDLFSGEEERRTTVLIRSYGFSLGRYVLCKALFQFLLISNVFSSVLLILILPSHQQLLSAASIMDVVFFWALAIAYILFWFSVSLVINALKQSSLFNGVALISVWVILLLGIPYMVSFRAIHQFPIPSREIQALTKRTIAKQVDRDKALEKIVSQNPEFGRFRTDTTVQLIFEATHGYPKYVSYQNELEARYRLMEDSVLDQLLSQESACRLARFASPSLVTTQAMNLLAATSTVNFVSYMKAREDYYQQWRQQNLERVLMKQPVYLDDLDRIAAFRWVNPAPYTLVLAIKDIAFLIILAGILSGASLLQYRNM